METILERILAEKRKEVQLLKEQGTTFSSLSISNPRRSFIQTLKESRELAIISEFKRASPSKGVINQKANPIEQARIYQESGAAAISVLTDPSFFQGSFEDLKAVRSAVSIPVLCKDFIIDALQVDAAAASGADLILLIVAALDDEKLQELFSHASMLGLEALVEVHNEAEVERALRIGGKLIGVNNRDLKTFHVSLETTESLAPLVKREGALLISESGIQRKEDVIRVKKAGANGILVGEALMKSPDIHRLLLDFQASSIEEQG